MNAIPQKSKLRYIAHNPTGELVKIITKELKTSYGKKESNNR